MSNRLQYEDSPYLQQHATNPVDWYPWGREAFEKAKTENKVVFLSIGYSSCHWCHVMRRESFENPDIAKILNKFFVSIKVDREERPDIDKHCQELYQLMNGRAGGWPTSIFMSYDLKPFYAATYLPPEPKYGLMSFTQLLETIAQRFQEDKELLLEKSDEILSFLNQKKTSIEATKLDISIVKKIENHALQLIDKKFGGFGKAPKFPQTSILTLLLDTYLLTKTNHIADSVKLTLDSMSKGGFYDRVDGGFCRYSTDDQWLVPHFEKMTYDNALLSSLYLKAYHILGDESYKNIAFETLDFMLTKMSENHLFYSASDADSNGEEGYYFAYELNEVLEVFTKEGVPTKLHHQLCEMLNITKEGNFHGKSIVKIDDFSIIKSAYFAQAINALKKIRERRTYPFIDKKIQLSWNAMIVKSLFEASRVDGKYLQDATSALNMLLETMRVDNQLYHTVMLGKIPKIRAFLEDYAYLGIALIEGYRTTMNEEYLIQAIQIANSAIEENYEYGLWKFSRGEFETIASKHDNSYPSEVAVILDLLYSVSSLVDPVYKKFVFRTLEYHSYDLMRQPLATPKLTQCALRYLKDDIVLKASMQKIVTYTNRLDRLEYPYLHWRVSEEQNESISLCNSHSCFANEVEWEYIENILKSYATTQQ